MRGQQHIFFRLMKSCSWNNRNFMKWKMTPPLWVSNSRPQPLDKCCNRWAVGMWHFSTYGFGCSRTWFGDNDLFSKVSTRSANRTWEIAPIFNRERDVLETIGILRWKIAHAWWESNTQPSKPFLYSFMESWKPTYGITIYEKDTFSKTFTDSLI